MINTNSVAEKILVIPPQDSPRKYGVNVFVGLILAVAGIIVFISILFYRNKPLPKNILPHPAEPQLIASTPNPCRTSVGVDSAPCQIVVIFDYQKTKKETPELTKAFIEKLLSELSNDLSVKQIIISGNAPIHVIIGTPYEEEERIGKLIMQTYPEYVVFQNRVKLPGIQSE